MTIRYIDNVAILEEDIAVEDAESLDQWFAKTPIPSVDLGACEHVHASTLQLLLRRRPSLLAPPPDRFLANVLTLHLPYHPTETSS